MEMVACLPQALSVVFHGAIRLEKNLYHLPGVVDPGNRLPALRDTFDEMLGFRLERLLPLDRRH